MMDKLHFIRVDDNNLIDLTAEMAREIWNEHYRGMINREQLDYVVQEFQSAQAVARQIQEGTEYYLIKKGDDFLGYIALQEDKGLHISKYYLYKKMRGMGYGRQAMDFMEQRAAQNNIERIWLMCNRDNSDALKVYKKLGFKITGKEDVNLGKGYVEPDYILEKFTTQA